MPPRPTPSRPGGGSGPSRPAPPPGHPKPGNPGGRPGYRPAV